MKKRQINNSSNLDSLIAQQLEHEQIIEDDAQNTSKQGVQVKRYKEKQFDL